MSDFATNLLFALLFIFVVATVALTIAYCEKKKDCKYWQSEYYDRSNRLNKVISDKSDENCDLRSENEQLRVDMEKLKGADYIVDHTVRDAITALSEVHNSGEKSDSIYIIEECSELRVELETFTKLLCKNERNGVPMLHLVEESCDVLTTILALLADLGVVPETVNEKIVFKAARAVDRFKERGKL